MRSLWKKIALFALIAAAVTVLLEVFPFNFRAWQSRGLETEEMDLTMATDLYGNYPSFDGEPIRIEPDESGLYILYFENVSVESTSLRIRLSGDPALVEYTVALTDDGSEYRYAVAGYGVAAPGGADDILCPLHSNGTLYNLRLGFTVPAGSNIFIDSVEVNPSDVPVRMEPLRMTLCFLLLFLILCMWRLPWQKVVYKPGKGSHRAILLVCLLAVMAVNYTLALHRVDDPSRSIWKPVSVEQAQSTFADPHAKLFLAFAQGKAHVLDAPAPELAQMVNPYDHSARREQEIDFPLDYVYYEGHYYVYFGAAPLLVYYPFYWLTGGLPSTLLSALLLTLLADAAIFYAAIGLARKYAGRVNLFLLSAVCVTCALVSAGPHLLIGGNRYNNTILSNVFAMAAAIGFGMHATLAKTGKGRVTRFLLCGLFFGLQGMARANTLLITTVFLAPAFIGVLTDREAPWRTKIRDAFCFLAPALALLCAVMYYNFIRFGSVAQFGQAHQLTGEDIHYNVFKWEYVPQALVYFLLSPIGFTPEFPWVDAQMKPLNVSGNYIYYEPGVGMFAYPMMWILFLLPLAVRKLRLEKQKLCLHTASTWILPLLMTLPLMVVTYYYAGFVQRYGYDFLLTFTLISGAVALFLLDADDDRLGLLPALRHLFVLLCFLSCAASVLFGFRYVFGAAIRQSDPVWYARLTQMFFPY